MMKSDVFRKTIAVGLASDYTNFLKALELQPLPDPAATEARKQALIRTFERLKIEDLLNIAARTPVEGNEQPLKAESPWTKVFGRSRAQMLPKEKPELQSLANLADYLGLDLRKRVKAMAADYAAEIDRLYKEGRYEVAVWSKRYAWMCAIWYMIRSPLDWVASYFIAQVKGK